MPMPPGIIVQGSDGPIDFGRVSPEDPTHFRLLMAEYAAAANEEEGTTAEVAQRWGFAVGSFGAMRDHMRRAFPAMGNPGSLAAERARIARGQTADAGTLERYCEIMGAMMAWASSRASVEHNLERYFHLTRNDVNALSLHWGASTDMAEMQRLAAMQQTHLERYLTMPM